MAEFPQCYQQLDAIKEAIDQMGVEQPDSNFKMAANFGSEYAYLLAGTEDEKKRAESLIQQVPTAYMTILNTLRT